MYLRSGASSCAIIALYVVAILNGVSAYYGYSSSSSSSTNSKLNEINRKLDILTNEVSRLADVTSNELDAKSEALDPVVLISVDREPGPDGNVFTIRYTKNVEEVLYEIYAEDHRITSGTNGDKTDGDSELTFICSERCRVKSKVALLFSNRNESSKMQFEVQNQGTETLHQDRFTVPTLLPEHSEDLVYHYGRNVSVWIVASYGEDKGFSEVSASLGVSMLGSNTYSAELSRHWIFKTERKTFLETEKTLLTVRTAVHPISGFLVLSLTFRDPSAFIVQELTVKRSMIVRPFNQSQAFPDDFLMFKPDDRQHSYNHMYQACQIGANCTFSCKAVGNAITSMQVEELSGGLAVNSREYIYGPPRQNEQWESVDDTSELMYEYTRVIDWTVNFSAGANDTMFKCSAETASQNKSQEIYVSLLTEEFRIDQNRSGIEVEIDEGNPSRRKITFTCTVIGRPFIDGYFLLNTETNNHYIHSRVIRKQQFETVMQSIQYADTRMPEDIISVTCKADSLRFKHAAYTMLFPSLENLDVQTSVPEMS
ncbi:hypothetical protein PoB_001505100 [Plakobranchus ocellatus]|uniref:Uncharacterized protein n=1 Tax=Plakobranchus ocellatus TaxID=259542 RepID=A0AAV3YYB8_9GAST|nr:hypothetical protein PoB_001505100 [Plakobranchus ocellatus]